MGGLLALGGRAHARSLPPSYPYVIIFMSYDLRYQLGLPLHFPCRMKLEGLGTRLGLLTIGLINGQVDSKYPLS